ncbi:MAG: tRNA glutamyl-Q(34) synthetase GluQRS [SAR86 cluster bacterium]|uniref:Glutamyl-Q tRNA(Asp) synthetase n=1 Tax=SAR86 cluster bacterium TaxID=2030880 RepID=A0A2A5CA24_9GAMM|nr:tRNA glutamyl-Q(34) synthetase GluQRS [Gammaproteobacteria bacterium AH-315-E17]PCJ40603.1 MAG: tRNA glutamyl-Q(34) synthetase GluQRS [SAR86 cluster bacterium]
MSPYRGRFAPSPTGPLHAGSLIAALASYLDARANKGKWFVRMEDLDPPRESTEAANQILQALECLNLNWDGEVLYQSRRHKAYHDALAQLQRQDLVFPCICSRQDLRACSGIYPGTCSLRDIKGSDLEPGNYALRCKVSNSIMFFDDLLQGKQSQNLEAEIGDFIIKRKDGLYSYQLAVVVDDTFQEITHIVRGIDLIGSSHRQIYLQKLLDYPQPVYSHIPVITNSLGQKLSKQHHATALNLNKPSLTLYQALLYLQQRPPAELQDGKPSEILLWAIENWKIKKLKNLQQLDEGLLN